MDKKIGIVMIIFIFMYLGFGTIIPVIPVMVQDLGAAPYHLGLLLAIYAAASFFSSPLWSKLSHRIGRRSVILIGLAGVSISFIGLSTNSLWIMYISRFFGGLFSGAVLSCSMAFIADINSEQNKKMWLAGKFIGIGYIIGPAIGGLLSIYGIAIPFLASFVLGILIFILTWRYMDESWSETVLPIADREKVPIWKSFHGSIKYLYGLSFLISFMLASLESILQYFEMVKISVNMVQFGLMFTISRIVGAVIQGQAYRIKKGAENISILIGLSLSGISFFLLLFSSNFWSATFYLAVFSIGHSLIRPVVNAFINRNVKLGQYEMSRLTSFLDSAGRIIGPLVGTLLFQINIQYPFILEIILSFLAILLLFGYRVWGKKGYGKQVPVTTRNMSNPL